MISETSISVDDATRQVIDELCDGLAQRPTWADQFKDDMSTDVHRVVGEALGALKLNEAIKAAQAATVASIGESQRQTISAVQAATGLAEPGAKSLRDLASEHAQLIACVLGALQQTNGALEQQRVLVAQLGSDQASALATCSRVEASVRKLTEAISAMQAASVQAEQHQEGALAAIQTAVSDVGPDLRKLEAAQVRHGQVLSSLAESVAALSRPWWKKLF